MLGKITAGAVIAFWVAMMAALVRMEFFPEAGGLGDVPPAVVLSRIFNHEEDTRLNVSYQGESIGFCKVEISPVLPPGDRLETAPPAKPTAYRVHSEVTLTLSLMGTPSRVRLVGDSLFNDRYEIESFHLKTTVGAGTIDMQGDAASKKVHLDFDVGGLREQREFDFAQVQGVGLASAIGLPGLSSASLLGGGPPTAFGGTNSASRLARRATLVRLADLRVGEVPLRTYLVESKIDQNMWARMWVSQRGEVLKVDTSFGLTMLADVLSDQLTGPYRGRKATR